MKPDFVTAEYKELSRSLAVNADSKRLMSCGLRFQRATVFHRICKCKPCYPSQSSRLVKQEAMISQFGQYIKINSVRISIVRTTGGKSVRVAAGRTGMERELRVGKTGEPTHVFVIRKYRSAIREELSFPRI